MPFLFPHMLDYGDGGNGILHHYLYFLFVDKLLINPSLSEQMGVGEK